MPPKRVTSRRAGSVAITAARQNGPPVMSPAMTPTHSSELQLRLSEFDEMTKTIDIGPQQAHQRDIRTPNGHAGANNEHQMITRSQRHPASVAASPSPLSSRRSSTDFSLDARPSLRQTTPDQQQLLDGLHELTESSSPSREHTPLGPEPDHSTDTSTPPVQQTLPTASASTVPSLGHPNFTNGNDSGDQRKHSDIEPGQSTLKSPQNTNTSFDNESMVSWGIERNLHSDSLHYTQPRRYLQDTLGRNITASPRRLSSLAFPHENLEQASNDLVTTNIAPPHKRASDSTTHIAATTAPNHTSNLAVPLNTYSASLSISSRPKLLWALIITLMALAIFGAYRFGDQLTALATSISSPLLVNGQTTQTHPNATHPVTIYRLSTEVKKLSAQISSMAQDVSSIKSEWSKHIIQATSMPTAEDSQVSHKVNFLSLGMGPAIDPSLTTPSLGRKHTFFQRIQSYITGNRLMVPKPPIAALTPWDGVGDCWCSSQRDGMTQMAIQLGQPMVPEEIVIEHIPKGATLEPGSAPREMELWAQFTPIQDSVMHPSPQPPLNLASSRFHLSFLTRFFSYPRTSPGDPTLAAPTSHSTLPLSFHDTILETLRLEYWNEPEKTYSHDVLLGPSFFRVGSWQYNIDDKNNIQHFSLVDINMPTLRVEKVVIRVKSTWGAPHTCLYRLKLHGHV